MSRDAKGKKGPISQDAFVSDADALVRLRTRLTRTSCLLTCGILVALLVVAWTISAYTAYEADEVSLAALATDDVPMEALAEDAPVALYDDITYLGGSAPDSTLASARVAERPFRVVEHASGSTTLIDRPSTAEGDDIAWTPKALESLVSTARARRAEAGRYLRPQTTEAGGRTWLWTTRVVTAKPVADADVGDQDDTAVTFFESGDLQDYLDKGQLAGRVYAFVDATSTHAEMRLLALRLGIAGIVGCVLLMLVCRTMIDRALTPVAEAQTRQREFVIKASHELKTPLASLSANLDALEANGSETVASQERWTSNMRADIDQMAARTYELLERVTAYR